MCVFVATTHLVGAHEVKADVGVAGGGVNTVLAEVLAHILGRGLGEEPIDTLPKGRDRKTVTHRGG